MPEKSSIETEVILEKEIARETREKILEDLDFALAKLKEASQEEQIPEEKKGLDWILKSAEDALREARDSEDGKYEAKIGEYSQREGVPVDELINWLKERAEGLKAQGKEEEGQKIDAVRETLEKNSQDYWQVHFGKSLAEIDWTREEEAKQYWRTELEAKYIFQDWRKTGDKEEDYKKAKEAMARRRELVLPPKKEAIKPEEVKPEEVKPEEVKPEEVKPEEVKPEPKKEKIKIKGYVVEIEDVLKDLAILEANRRFGEIERKGSRWNPARIVKRSLLAANPDGWWLKLYKEALDGIRKNKNLMTEIEARLRKGKKVTLPEEAEKRHYEDLDKILEAYSEGLVKEKEITEKGVVDPEIQKEFSEILVKHARDEFRKAGMSDLEVRKVFDEEVKGRIIDKLLEKGKKFTPQERADIKVKESMYGHNFWNIAEKYKAEIQKLIQEKQAESGEGQKENITNYVNGLLELDLTLGAKDPDIYQKEYRKLLERWEGCVKFSEKHRYLGSIVANPMLVGLSGSIAGNMVGRGIARVGLTAGLTTLAGLTLPVSTILGGAGAAAITLWKREQKKGREELRRIMRDEALGFEPGGKQAQKIREKGGYSVKNAYEMSEKIKKIREKSALDDEDRKLIAEALARRDLEHQTGSILLKTVGEAGQREKLRIGALNSLDREVKNTLGHFNLKSEDLKTERDNYITTLNQEMADKDKEFKGYLRKKSAIAAAGGAAVGLVFGATVYKGLRYIKEHFFPNSSMARLFDWWEGGKKAVPLETAKLHEVPVPGLAGTVRIPEGYSLIQDAKAGTGFFDLLDNKGNLLIDNLEIDKAGKLTDASKKLLEKAGLAFKEQVREIAETPGLGIHEWWQEKIGNLRKFNRVDWHDEPGKRGIFNLQFEGKQQQFHIRVDQEGVKLDFKKMMQNVIDNIKGKYKVYGTNWDQSVDTKLQHLARELKEAFEGGKLHEQFGINAIPDQIADSKGLGTFFGPLNEKYEYFLPLDKAKAIFDEGALNQALEKAGKGARAWLRETDLNLDHLEFYFGDPNSGHVLATATGKNSLKGIAQKIYDYLIGQKPEKGLPAPPVPAFWPRRTPEAGVPKGAIPPEVPPYYGYYSYEAFKEREAFYRERLSPTLKEKPQAELDFVRESNGYKERDGKNNIEYRQDLEKILGQPGMQEPMHEECRVAVCIPVYDLGEGKIIEHGLEQYRKQIEKGTVKPEEFEIVLFLNHPKDKKEALKIESGAEGRVAQGKPEAYDTEEVVKQYMAKHPEMKIRVMKKEFPERPKWGWITKYNYDAATERARARRNPKDPDIIILTNDIDVRAMNDKYLHHFIDAFDKNAQRAKGGQEQKVDGIVGRIDHDAETYKKWPVFFLATRFDQFLDAQSRYGFKEKMAITPQKEGEGYTYFIGPRREKRVVTQGRNTALRGSMYSAIGGANTNTDAGGDTELGYMVTLARRGILEGALEAGRYPFKYANKAWLETDPRRELGKYKEGQPITWAWSDWGAMKVYGKTFDEQIQGDKEELNPERLGFEFNHIIRKWGLSADSRPVKRALFWLGFQGEGKDYAIQNGEIKISGLENVQKKLEMWKPRRERWQEIEEKKAKA